MHLAPDITDPKAEKPTYESLAALADEIVAPDKRGRNIINGFMSGVQVFGTTHDYERLKIYNGFTVKTENGVTLKDEIWTTVIFKSPGCTPAERPFTFSAPPEVKE